ncbi:MAG: hypothetical protein ACKVT1_05520 [Dehalococcoidia bacterium]
MWDAERLVTAPERQATAASADRQCGAAVSAYAQIAKVLGLYARPDARAEKIEVVIVNEPAPIPWRPG